MKYTLLVVCFLMLCCIVSTQSAYCEVGCVWGTNVSSWPVGEIHSNGKAKLINRSIGGEVDLCKAPAPGYQEPCKRTKTIKIAASAEVSTAQIAKALGFTVGFSAESTYQMEIALPVFWPAPAKDKLIEETWSQDFYKHWHQITRSYVACGPYYKSEIISDKYVKGSWTSVYPKLYVKDRCCK